MRLQQRRIRLRGGAARATSTSGRMRGKGYSRLDLHRRSALDVFRPDQLVDHPSPLLELVRRELGILVPEEVAGGGRTELEDVDAVGRLDKGCVAREDDEVLGDGAGGDDRLAGRTHSCMNSTHPEVRSL